jgi:hypothetical protein
MSHAVPSFATGQLLLLALPLLAATACATSAPSQTPLMKSAGVSVSAEAMRVRMRALAPQMIASLEYAADQIRTSSIDPVVQRRALVWKLNTSTELYRELFSEDPAAGLMDCWAMLIQVEQFLSSPQAERELGPPREQALAQLEKMEVRVVETVRWAAPNRDPAKLRAELVTWASTHPVEGNLATRRSLREDLAARTAGPELSAFENVGVASDNLEGIIARMDYLPSILPKQSIWEAELAYQDFGLVQVNQMMKRADMAMDRVDRILEWMGGPNLDSFAERERTAMVEAVDRERLALTALVDAEQNKIEQLIARERATVLEEVRKERIAATADVRRAAAESITEASLAAKGVIDHMVLRLALLFAGSILLAGAVAYGVRRLGRARSVGEVAVTSGAPIDLGLRKP